MKNIVIVPVVVDRLLTRRAVNSALGQDIGDVEVWIVGNGAVDGLVEYLRGVYWSDARVKISAYPAMRSLNWLWNAWITLAFALGHEHVLVINNDIFMRTDTYRLLVDDGGLFVTGVSVDTVDGVASADPTSKSPHPCFSCFLIRRECWELTGKFDDKFWAYASDADYHLRMEAAGVNAYALAVPFFHETSATIRKVDNDTRDRLQALADADREMFKVKWGFAVGSDEYYSKFKSARENKYAKEGVL